MIDLEAVKWNEIKFVKCIGKKTKVSNSSLNSFAFLPAVSVTLRGESLRPECRQQQISFKFPFSFLFPFFPRFFFLFVKKPIIVSHAIVEVYSKPEVIIFERFRVSISEEIDGETTMSLPFFQCLVERETLRTVYWRM